METSAAAAIAPTQGVGLTPPACHRAFAADTDSITLITELRSFLRRENYNGFELQISTVAYEKAESYLESASRTIRLSQLKPELTPDGDGGIDIEWERNGRHLALNFAGAGGGNFISWREPHGRYEGAPATKELLMERLNWLTR
jgi:hypothetical protein